jgi:hypothetical protein
MAEREITKRAVEGRALKGISPSGGGYLRNRWDK